MHASKWALVLAIFWLLLSGYFTPLLLSFGGVSVVVVIYLLIRMDAIDHKPQQIDTGLRLIRYVPWLIGQIFMSSARVCKLIWVSPKKISPTLTKINTHDIPPDCRVLYANSITLTPGTLSVDLVDDQLTVHALEESSIDELKEGYMERKIARIWSKNK